MIETTEALRRPSTTLGSPFPAMWFKRKPSGSTSGGTADQSASIEKEARQRHRLSKPQTSKSLTNLAILATEQADSQSTLHVHSVSAIDLARPMPVTQERQVHERARPISTVHEEELMFATDTGGIPRHGAALVINAIESTQNDGHSATSTPLSLRKPRRRLSAMMFSSRSTSNIRAASRNHSTEDVPSLGEVSRTSQPPTAPVAAVVDGAPLVLDRRSCFTPGAATRLHKTLFPVIPVATRESFLQLHHEPSSELINVDQLNEADQSCFGNQVRSLCWPASRHELLDTATDRGSPNQHEGCATPPDIDYHSLGGLRLGSLHVTNGRASPAPSDLSRVQPHRSSPLLRRTVSSEYGSETGSIKRTHTPPSALRRPQLREVPRSCGFSPISQPQPQIRRDTSYNHEDALEAQNTVNNEGLNGQTTDSTASMAMSYIAEVSNSPFSPQASQWSSPLAGQRSSSPTGSVLVTTKKSEHEAELFEDEAVEESPGSVEDCETVGTCRTPSDAESYHVSACDTYDKLRNSFSPVHLQPPQDAHEQISDSGYSSNASLQSMKDERNRLGDQHVQAFEQPRVESATLQVYLTNRTVNHEPVLGLSSQQTSTLDDYRKATPEAVPTATGFGRSTTGVATSQATMTTPPSPPKTPSKKLQRKPRPHQPPRPEQIMVMGAQSGDAAAIPPIPQHQTDNLHTRAQQFPELQRTFMSLHHIKDSADSPEQAFKHMEIRFPSPPPEPTSDEESPSRRRKTSVKRESWIKRGTFRPRIRNRNSVEQSSGEIGEAETQAIIQDFGTTANSLGGSPYDIAAGTIDGPQSRNSSRQSRTTPHGIAVTKTPVPDRRRLTMDDRTASAFARSKSKTLAERDRQDSVQDLKRLEYEKKAAVANGHEWSNKRPRPYSVRHRRLPSSRRASFVGDGQFDDPCRPKIQQQQQHAWPEESASQTERYSPRHASAATQAQQGPWQQHRSADEIPSAPPPRRSPQPEHQRHAQHYQSLAPLGQNQPEVQQGSYNYQVTAPTLNQQPSWAEQEQDMQVREAPAPLPPRHSPRPSFVEPDISNDQMESAPPPPSHSPRPMDLYIAEPVQDIWAAPAKLWQKRRKSLGELLGHNSAQRQVDNSGQYSAYADDDVAEEDLYPAIPPRASQTAYMPHESHTPYTPSPKFWQPAADHHAMTYEPDLSRVTPTETFEDPTAYLYMQQEQSRRSPRPLPRPKPRRASGHSQANSYASSLAEELHPDKDVRPTVPPEIGRYSGGLQYGYETGKGFGGSAGTRTVSGRAQGSRKGVLLSTGFGVDLSDVPIIAAVRSVRSMREV